MYSFHRMHISVRHFVGVFVYAGAINRSPTAADGLPKHCERIAITLRTPTKLVANIPSGVGADSSRPYPCITKYAYPFHRIRAFALPHTHFHIIKYVYSHHRTHIYVRHFVGVFIYAGTINRSPTAADGLPKHCERIAITLRTPTKLVANIPSGVGADSSRPYPCITKYAYPFHRIRAFALPHTHFHIIKYVYSHHRTHIYVRHFVGVFIYAGTINRSPTAADGLPKCY